MQTLRFEIKNKTVLHLKTIHYNVWLIMTVFAFKTIDDTVLLTVTVSLKCVFVVQIFKTILKVAQM
jgi:hypothetical protein